MIFSKKRYTSKRNFHGIDELKNSKLISVIQNEIYYCIWFYRIYYISQFPLAKTLYNVFLKISDLTYVLTLANRLRAWRVQVRIPPTTMDVISLSLHT